MSEMKAVILAAGRGTRMLPLTEHRPKPLVPVAGRPILEHIVGGLASAGIDEVCLVVGWHGEQIEAHFGDGRRLGAHISYVWQSEYGGTGAAVLLAEDFVGEDRFVLGWGDILVPPCNYRRLMQTFRAEQPEAMLAVNVVDDPWEGAAVYVRDGHVERIIEKPDRGTSSTNYNNAGLFVFGPELIGTLKQTRVSSRGELEVPSAIGTLLEGGLRIRALEIDGYWSDVARPASALAISGEVIAWMSHSGTIIHPEAHLAPGAEIKPPALIGPGATIGRAVIGPNATVMSGASVGDAARLSNTCLMPNAAAGDGAQLDWVFVEEGEQVAADARLAGSEAEARVVRGE